MGILSIIQIIFFVITNLPSMIKAIKEIIDMIKKSRNKPAQKMWRARLSRHLADYKVHGDPERLGREIKQMKAELEKEI